MTFAVSVTTAAALWVAAVVAHLAWLNYERRMALLFLEQVIAESKRPRHALHRHVQPPPPVVGRWEYDHLPPKRLTQKAWFRP